MTKEELENMFDYPNIETGLMSRERKQCALIMATRIAGILQDVIDVTGGDEFENEYYIWNGIRKELNEELGK